MKTWMLLALAALIFAGCNNCGGLWFQDCPDPTPDPDATPAPPQPIGTIVKVLPSAVSGSLGSIDFAGGQLYEYCRGEAAIYARQIWNGEVTGKVTLDGRLTKLWAVAWDEKRGCWWATNPDCENVDYNLMRLGVDGNIEAGRKMMGGHSSKWIRFWDVDVNEDYEYTDADGNKIEKGMPWTGDSHFESLFKFDYINVYDGEPDRPWWEQYWFKSDINHRAVTRTGSTYWAAEWEGNRIVEYNQGSRKSVATRTGRVITLPGYVCSSLKTYDGLMWAKAQKSGQSYILAISLGE